MANIFDRRSLVLVCVLAAATAGCRGGDANDEGMDDAAMMDEVPDRSATLTGCLEQGQIPGTFVLTRASAGEADESVGTSGSQSQDQAASETDAETSQTYALVNTGDTDLTRYVGSRVSVAGRFQAEAQESPTLERAPDLAEDRGADRDTTALIVESVDPVGGQCQ